MIVMMQVTNYYNKIVIRATSKTVSIGGRNLDVNEYLDMDKLDEEANIFIDGLSPTTTQL